MDILIPAAAATTLQPFLSHRTILHTCLLSQGLELRQARLHVVLSQARLLPKVDHFGADPGEPGDFRLVRVVRLNFLPFC